MTMPRLRSSFARYAVASLRACAAPFSELHESSREPSKLPVAVQTAKANEQHYEVPADFYKIMLGPWLK